MVRLALLAPLLAIATPAVAQVGRRCGYKMALCSKGLVCIPDDPECMIYGRCSGTCQKPPPTYKPCGGFSPNPPRCDEGETCIPDVRNPDWEIIPDLPGICYDFDLKDRCGGPGIIAPPPCSAGKYCYDDPTDECDPENSSIACRGICVYKSPMFP